MEASIFAVNACAIDVAKALVDAERSLGKQMPRFDRLSPQQKQHYIEIGRMAIDALRFGRA